MPSPSPTENLVVIGSGPAGYTAALYAARANLAPLLITGFQEGGIPGGQLMTTTHVENFPGFPQGVLGPELMDRMKAQAVRWGARLLEADADRLHLSRRPFIVEAQGQELRAHAVILATGARANRLHLPREERFWSRGISACAVCDGATPQFRHEPLAVVGGGDSACEEAHVLTKYGSHVHLIVRRDRLRASRAMADRVLANDQITVHWDHEVTALQGEDWLAAVELRRRLDGSAKILPVRGLFYAIGHTPNTGIGARATSPGRGGLSDASAAGTAGHCYPRCVLGRGRGGSALAAGRHGSGHGLPGGARCRELADGAEPGCPRIPQTTGAGTGPNAPEGDPRHGKRPIPPQPSGSRAATPCVASTTRVRTRWWWFTPHQGAALAMCSSPN